MTVTAPAGFRAAGVAAGLKSSGEPDVALVVNDGPHKVAAAVFTSNRVQAAPVVWSRQAVADGVTEAVVLNSGGANACTGPEGFADTHRTAEHVAAALGVSAGDVLVCSTGLIGERLPMDRLLAGVDAAVACLGDGGADAARAIMTTDTVPKTVHVARDGWSVGGMAKGAGMLAPGLATMLCVLTTDAVVDAGDADAAPGRPDRLARVRNRLPSRFLEPGLEANCVRLRRAHGTLAGPVLRVVLKPRLVVIVRAQDIEAPVVCRQL